MSWQATSWALRQAAVGSDCVARLILVSLGDYARPDGSGAYPSVATLMQLCGKSEITVRRKLAWMEHIGVIRRGDQSAVSSYPANRRPVVWDLVMDVPRIPVDDRRDEQDRKMSKSLGCHFDTPKKPASRNADIPAKSRGVRMIPQISGVSGQSVRGVVHDTSRGVAGDTQTINNNHHLNQPPKAPQGGAAVVGDDPAFDSLRTLWPKKSGNPAKLRMLWNRAKAQAGAERILASARQYLKTSGGIETRYLKGLSSWLADPVCYAAAIADAPEGRPLTRTEAVRRWHDQHDLDSGCPSLYEAVQAVNSHPEVSAKDVPMFLSGRFLGEEAS